MRLAKLFFPGKFEDAYLYAGCLLILTEDRTLRVYNLRRLLSVLESNYPELAPVLTLMFSRNDWLGKYQFKTTIRNEFIRNVILRAFDKLSRPLVINNNEDIGPNTTYIKINDTSLLDMLIYNRRLYMGASGGFYHFDLNWNQGTVEVKGQPHKRIDARCVNALAGYGSVNASCGKEGLFAAIDEFGWLKKRENGYPDMVPLAERSLRAGWIDYDLVNYTSYENPFILRSTHTKSNLAQNQDSDKTVLTQIGVTTLDVSSLFRGLQRRYGFRQEAIQYTYTSNDVLFVHTMDGEFYSLKIKFDENDKLDLKFNRTFKGEGTRILSANTVNPGIVIETDDRVLLYSGTEWHTLIDSPVIAVRTFPRSERYEHVATITTEEGVFLIGMCEDRLLEK